jgi:hypothetical protein
MPFTINGFGTMLCGERDYGLNGSYVTTEWIAVAYVPIGPLKGMRILEGAYQNGYTILENIKLNVRQVQSVYAWFALMVAIGVSILMTESAYLAISLIMVAPLPRLLRHRALNRLKKEIERKRMGLPPTTIG